jgi:hypothetical protein
MLIGTAAALLVAALLGRWALLPGFEHPDPAPRSKELS